jgi:hypothetical protein
MTTFGNLVDLLVTATIGGRGRSGVKLPILNDKQYTLLRPNLVPLFTEFRLK